MIRTDTTTADPAPAATAPPIGTTSPLRMTEQQLADEVAALNAHQFRELKDCSARQVRAAVRQIAERRADLTRELKRRAAERTQATKAQRSQEEHRARMERVSIGRRREDGRCPVKVDGQLRATVRRQGRGWHVWIEGDRDELHGAEPRQVDAVDRAVRVLDQRAEDARRQEERAAAPEGWIPAGEEDEPEVGEVIRYAQPGPHGAPWSRPLRVVRRVEEPPPYGVRFRLEALDGDGPGTSLAATRMPRFVRPAEATSAAFPPAPYRHREPEEHGARRIMGGQVGDELASLARRPAAPERAEKALAILARVEDGRSTDPAADMRAVADEAEAIRAATLAGDDPDRQYYAGAARAAHLLAARYAERFEDGGGRLTAQAQPQ